MAIAQIKNLQRRLANMESEATAALDRACGNNLWASIGPDAIDGLEDPAARAQANYYYGQLMTVRELQDVLGVFLLFLDGDDLQEEDVSQVRS